MNDNEIALELVKLVVSDGAKYQAQSFDKKAKQVSEAYINILDDIKKANKKRLK